MSSSSTVPTAKPRMRDALVAAAFQLFLERGYEETTVDDIVALAEVGRRSFFRYFPSKEDVVFPDHERCLADMTAFLAASPTDAEPVRRVCEAARLVLLMYAENPTFSVQRYRLTKKVPGLRAYELSVVWRYERALAEYLRGRFAGRPDGNLRANVIAASVVAAHNNALRSWLRSDGQGDAAATVDHALGYVQTTFGPSAGTAFASASPLARAPFGDHAHAPGTSPAPVTDQASRAISAPLPAPASPASPTSAASAGSAAAPASPAPDTRRAAGGLDDVIVLVTRRDAPLWRVVQEFESAVGRA